jgi:hypothetical protein
MVDLTRWRILGWRRITLRHSTRDRSQSGAGDAGVRGGELGDAEDTGDTGRASATAAKVW